MSEKIDLSSRLEILGLSPSLSEFFVMAQASNTPRPNRSLKSISPYFKLVRKGGFEPPRSCERQPLKLKAVNADRSRPRKIGVGRPSLLPIEAR